MNYKFDELKYDPTDYEALKKEIVELTDALLLKILRFL